MLETKYLGIKAGQEALKLIEQNGFRLSDVEVFIAPPSGPKWLILFELDKYFIDNWLSPNDEKVHFIGGSAGAWRAACYCTQNPKDALQILNHEYIHQHYSDDPFGKEVSDYIRKNVIQKALGESRYQEILANENRFLHICTSQAKFKTGGVISFWQKLKFARAIAANVVNRKYLNQSFERSIHATHPPIFEPSILKTNFLNLDLDSIETALCASGSIPFMMNPEIIDGHEHWDGGATDYHMALDYKIKDKLVLLPNFRSFLQPGWFDKYWPKRRSTSEQAKHIVMLYPKPAFLQKCPYQRLPDMEDFFEFENDQSVRIQAWLEATDLGKYLVDDLDKMLNWEGDLPIEKL